MSDDQVDYGGLETDAVLYILKEKQNGKPEKIHSILQMPSSIPEILCDTKYQEYQSSNIYNILMVDVSGSMGSYWNPLVKEWNSYIAPYLIGQTKIYVFGNSVEFKRLDTTLKITDFLSGGTDLTGALQTIVSEIYSCQKKYVKIFLITDGDHNATEKSPDTIIQQMNAPQDSVCNVYILGIGKNFPVQYSIDIRSRLHTGSANYPSLFWVKEVKEMELRMKEISRYVCDGTSQSLKISMAGFFLPGGKAKDTFYLKEWVYFPCDPKQVEKLSFQYQKRIFHIFLQPCEMNIKIMKEVFQQWNSVIIQLQNKKDEVPSNTLPLMERFFNTKMEELKDTKKSIGSVRERLIKKEFDTYERDFRTFFKQIKAILTNTKFRNEVELAESILSTTVGGGKYETKILQIKGHTDKDYADDCQKFINVYEEHKHKIQELNVTPEDCCRITLSSTISDLQDPDFSMLMNLNKFEFLKNFTISGIPVHAPNRDSVPLNPWSFHINTIINAPYNIMSQVAIESFADLKPVEEREKKIELKRDNEQKICFNAIVPIFSPEVIKVMAPVINTRLYAMCSTFALLKNPHIIDFNIHMAALGVTWVKILYDYPTTPRPEFVNDRIKSIEATAALYQNRTGYTTYWELLKYNTAQALMTESIIQVNNKTLKCETLIKPMFIFHLYQKNEILTANVVTNIMKMLLVEYVGRCLSQYKITEKNSTPFTDFFAKTLSNQDLKRKWIENIREKTGEFKRGFIFADFYTLEQVQKAAKKTAIEEIKTLKDTLIELIPIELDMKKVEKLRSLSLAGDLSWNTLKVFAREAGLKEAVIHDLFNITNVFMYTAHALQYRHSRERLTNPLVDYDASITLVTKHVKQENYDMIAKDCMNDIVKKIENNWLKAYDDVHREVIRPMTRHQILVEASELGVQVTDTTFEKVYQKYRPNVGLLSNACQCRNCPYFLIPRKCYNQHVSVGRRNRSTFPHNLHQAAFQYRNSDLQTLISSLENGRFKTCVSRETIEPFKKSLVDLMEIYKIYTSTTI